MLQNNIILAYFGAIISSLFLAYAKYIGADIPDSITYGLPGAVYAILAHGCDIVRSWLESKKPK